MQFSSTLSEEFVGELIVDVIAIFLGYVLAKGLSFWNWVGAILALAAKATMQILNLVSDWGNAQRLRAIALANIVLGLIAISTSIGKNFLAALFNIVTAGAMSSIYIMWDALSTAAMPIEALGPTWVDIADAIINIGIAGFAIVQSIWLTQ